MNSAVVTGSADEGKLCFDRDGSSYQTKSEHGDFGYFSDFYFAYLCWNCGFIATANRIYENLLV